MENNNNMERYNEYRAKTITKDGNMTFLLPVSKLENITRDTKVRYRSLDLPVRMLGVDLLMDFILDGEDEDGNSIVVVTEATHFDSCVFVLN